MKKFFYTIACIAALVPSAASAACTSGCLQPFSNFTNITDFVTNALKVLVSVSLPIIGFFIIYVGFQFVAAQGNSGKIQKAKENFLYVIIGSMLVLGAWVLATLIGSTVSQLLN